jgi:TetR/AcrR family fatty acid metabolism transcriptional regulator
MDTQSLSDRLAAVRRDHIVDAATRVFAAKGFNGSSIRDVARAAGVADGTIYNYFDNKESLLFAILDRLNETARRQQDMTVAPGADAAEFVRAYVRHRFAVLEHVGFDSFQVLLSELLVNARLRERCLSEIIEPTFAIADAASGAWTESDQPRRYDARLLVRAQAGLVVGCLFLKLCGEPLLNERWAELPDLIADLIVNNVGGHHVPGTAG